MRKTACSANSLPAITIDTREQRPYAFASIRDAGRSVAVETRIATLKSGDYSLEGFEDRVAVERKSLADLYGTLGKGRKRFERELGRLHELDYACVMVEAEWSEVMNSPPAYSKLSPRSVFGSVVAFSQRYYRVHWCFVPDRDFAEVMTYRILERFYKDHTR